MERSARKDTVRRLVLAHRARIEPNERASAGVRIAETVLALPEIQRAESVIAFVSIASEVPTETLLRGVLGLGKTLLLPYVGEDGVLRASAVGSLEELEPGYRGIPEPRTRFASEPSSAGAIVVPGVAFDPLGGRLGYGGGFYDTFLRGAPGPPRIGVCFACQLVDQVPMDDNDESVDIVVTEEGAIKRGE